MTKTPGPVTWLPGGHFLAFRRDPLTFFTNNARIYGDVARWSFGSQPVYLVSHPDWIEDVLVTSAKKFTKGIALQRAKRLLGEGLLTAEGQMHLRQRRTIQPLFHKHQVQRFADAMVRHALRWRDTVKDGATIDVTAAMGGLTLAIVGDTLFSSDVQGDADEVRDALHDAVQSFAYAVLPRVELLEKLPIGPFVKVRKARTRLDRIILRVIAERRAHRSAFAQDASADRTDLVSMLLAARDPENPSEPGMSDQQIRDEAMTIFLAGHETTANAMAWTWHLLGTHREAEKKLHEEIGRVLGSRPPAFEDVPKLEYARAIIAESMRLFPPAWTMGRRAIEPYAIGGHEIEKHALVLLSQWVVHRDPRWWPEADAFRPERWLMPDAARPKYAYFPFGGGNRVCIGESFAWTEAILLLATIAQHWRFTPVTPPTAEPRITLRPAGLRMRGERAHVSPS
ncbi:MAG TPA: cytochrome P450 [Vicinamibacterales bacterium]|nr:cytochrome P450 [Vicinamibacterales bacterium]